MGKESINYTALLQQLKARDRTAFNLLYQNMRVTLYVAALDILKDEAAAQDLVQDFFVEFWYEEIYHQVESSLKGYLFRAIRNRALKYLKKQQTRQKLQRLSFSGFDFIPPDHKLEQDQLGSAIANALEKVPKSAAEVFILHYIEDLSHAQIADQLGISPNTVRNHIVKALRILRTELKKGQ